MIWNQTLPEAVIPGSAEGNEQHCACTSCASGSILQAVSALKRVSSLPVPDADKQVMRTCRSCLNRHAKAQQSIWPCLHATRHGSRCCDACRFTGEYWKARESGKWENIPDIFEIQCAREE